MSHHTAPAPSQLSASLSDARAHLEERRAALADGGGRGRVFRALDEAKRRRAIPGIYGRLGDLGTIDPKYDVAASQASGGAASMDCCNGSWPIKVSQ